MTKAAWHKGRLRTVQGTARGWCTSRCPTLTQGGTVVLSALGRFGIPQSGNGRTHPGPVDDIESQGLMAQ
jgi:hypothetical protein